MNKLKNILQKISTINLRKDEIVMLCIFLSAVIALLCGFCFGEKIYWVYYQNGKHIVPFSEYTDDNREKGSYFKINYFTTFIGFLLSFPIFYLVLSRLKELGLKVSKIKLNEPIINPAIVIKLRKIAKEKNIAPTSKTTDSQITDIYNKVQQSFSSIAEKRGETISEETINYLALKFMQVYEEFGSSTFITHLNSEKEYYLKNGLRQEYNQTFKF